MLTESPLRPSPPKASAASLPPPLLRLLPGGTNQFPGGTFTHCGPAPFHGAHIPNVYDSSAGALDGGALAGGTLSREGLDIPMNSARNGFDPQAVQAIATRLRAQPGALMLILREVQDRLGWVPAASVPVIAQVLNLSRAEVHGVVTFYHDFRHEPPGHNVLRLCQAESCQAMGAVALAEHACRRLGIGFGETTPDREFTLEAVYCLGNCGCSPAMLLNGDPYGRLTPERLDDLLAECRENRR
jgi:formate dehydrogenase subunit gamma